MDLHKRDHYNTSPCPSCYPIPEEHHQLFVIMEAASIIGALEQYVDGERNHADVSNTYFDYGDPTLSDILF
jgi:hypothetical protein